MKKAIVSGANGFVGTAVCKELVSRGIEVIGVIREGAELNDSFFSVSPIRLVFCNLSKYDKLSELILDRDVDVFFHFAWEGNSGPLRADVDVQINNVRFSCNAVEAASKLKCQRFVFASSIMEFEINKLMSTEFVPGVNTLYSSAKVAADYMTRTISGAYGIDYIRAVISNIYGPGEYSPRLINQSIRKMLAGEHCSFSEGKQLYDFIFVEDAAKSFVAIAEKGISNRTYYIGSERPRPLREFLIEMKNCINPMMEIGLGDIPFKGISLDYNEFDILAVKKDTGFSPTVSFQEGIHKTIDWIREDADCGPV